MTQNNKTSRQWPTFRQAAIVLALSAGILVLQEVVMGCTFIQVSIILTFNILFFASNVTRKLAIALLPFALFGMSYDWLRFYPNFKVNPIDTQALYDAEAQLFGFMHEGALITPNEYFHVHHDKVADLLAGLFYLCWVPVPLAFGIWLYVKGQRRIYLHFALVFLLVNLLGFIGYYVHPAAPPWYVMDHGFTPIPDTPGSSAGLARFDTMTGIPIFKYLYSVNSNLFAAVPSLHAAYILVATIYAIISRQRWWVIALFVFITLGIWWTAVYSCHHYIIDVLLGIATACAGILVFEALLMKLPPFRCFIHHYINFIS